MVFSDSKACWALLCVWLCYTSALWLEDGCEVVSYHVSCHTCDYCSLPRRVTAARAASQPIGGQDWEGASPGTHCYTVAPLLTSSSDTALAGCDIVL